jgi:hypothetical protein
LSMPDMNAEEFEVLVETVRKAACAGELVRADEVYPGGEAEFAALIAASGASDLAWIHESDKAYLYSDHHMTRAYAEAAALGASGNPLRMISATVRSDSVTYPRPTPVETFYGKPFCLSAEEVAAAVARMHMDSRYADITAARASNGAEFLFSSDHMSCDQAASMAEWLAVGQDNNP